MNIKTIDDLDAAWWKIEAYDDDGMARFAEAHIADLIMIAKQCVRVAKRLRELEAQGDASEDFYHRNCVSTSDIADLARETENQLGAYTPKREDDQ